MSARRAHDTVGYSGFYGLSESEIAEWLDSESDAEDASLALAVRRLPLIRLPHVCLLPCMLPVIRLTDFDNLTAFSCWHFYSIKHSLCCLPTRSAPTPPLGSHVPSLRPWGCRPLPPCYRPLPGAVPRRMPAAMRRAW